jgi:hypothetical protein
VISAVTCSDEISFWTFFLSPTFDVFIQDTIARFEATYPGVTVNWEDHQATFREDLDNAFAAGNAPDVINLSVSEGWVRLPVGKSLDRRGQPMTMKLNGKDANLKRSDFMRAAATLGLKTSDAEAAVDDMLARLEPATKTLMLPAIVAQQVNAEAVLLQMLGICRERIEAVA